jgi:hypothetical protein
MALKAWRVVQQFTFIAVVLVAALISEQAHNEGIACHLYIGLWSYVLRPCENACRWPSGMKNRPPDKRRPINLTREKVGVVSEVESQASAH